MDALFELTANDVARLNEVVCKHLSAIPNDRLKNVDVTIFNGPHIYQRKRAVDLSMHYWDLLKQSKSITKLFKDKVDTVLRASKEWNDILSTSIRGDKLNDEQIEFVSFVFDEYKNYFASNESFNALNDEWNAFMRKKTDFQHKEMIEAREAGQNQRQQGTSKSAAYNPFGGLGVNVSGGKVQAISGAILAAGLVTCLGAQSYVGMPMLAIGAYGWHEGNKMIKSTQEEKKHEDGNGGYGSTDEFMSGNDEESWNMNEFPKYKEPPKLEKMGNVSTKNMTDFFIELMKKLNMSQNNKNAVKRDEFVKVQKTLKKVMNGLERVQNECARIIKEIGDAQKELEQLRSRFAMDFADPPTAILVG